MLNFFRYKYFGFNMELIQKIFFLLLTIIYMNAPILSNGFEDLNTSSLDLLVNENILTYDNPSSAVQYFENKISWILNDTV